MSEKGKIKTKPEISKEAHNFLLKPKYENRRIIYNVKKLNLSDLIGLK